ncbi:4'-phosphopantetheinyl transferase superfamily protein [Streptomyces cyaneofuscatus]|nr:4'-phosphopantetheinyl transferase superfamily protein [Streptomyces cyaneofuscatus]
MPDMLAGPAATAVACRAGEPLLGRWTPAPKVTVAVARISEVLASPPALARLQPEEHRSAAAMAPWRGREHLAGRALLRLLLAGESGEEEGRLPVLPEPGGRPRLADRPGTGVSVSHSGPYTAAAVAGGQDVGVDLQLPQPPSPGMLRRCCPPDTAARLAALTPERMAYTFARVWAVQEACVKARGTGLPGAPWKVPADPDAVAGTWQAVRWRRLAWPTEDGTRTAALVCAFAPPGPVSGRQHPPTGTTRHRASVP